MVSQRVFKGRGPARNIVEGENASMVNPTESFLYKLKPKEIAISDVWSHLLLHFVNMGYKFTGSRIKLMNLV
jgi:hypothetical protein